MNRLLGVLGRIVLWTLAGFVVIVVIWFAANRLFDEKPDPQRAAFVFPPEEPLPDDKNIAVGILGLGAPRGTDFLEFGAHVKGLYDRRVPSAEIQRELHGTNELRLSATHDEIRCWIDPENYKQKDCLPFDKAPDALKQNRELLERYKRIQKLPANANTRFFQSILLDLTNLSVAEMRLDMHAGNYEAAYAKWSDQFRFVRTYLRGRDTWVGKMIGLVIAGSSLPVLEDLLVKKPQLARAYADELLEVLRPGGIEAFNLSSSMRADYLEIDAFLRGSFPESDPFLDTIDRLAQKLVQKERFGNRYARYSQDYIRALHRPWPESVEELQRLRGEYVESFGWKDLVDPFGWILFARHVRWQLKSTSTLHQMNIVDGRLRLATLVVQMLNSGVRDRDISAFLERADSRLKDPFTGKPMIWDSEHGRIYFVSADYKCLINYIRVPVLDPRSGRLPPKVTDGRIC
ncbi:MAG TPA: hypothetical protein VKD03_00895 [Burkholderiales bacterium]|nr:hypothetical protein [Burkholderiales bacterium]